MTAATHPVATDHLPSFITPPGETDVLMVAMAVILLASVLGFGIFFLRLHTLPERMAHKSHKLQFEIVAVLGLIALFTHQHIFWVAGLLLALIEFPDFGGWLGRIAGSVERIADNQSNGATKPPPEVADADRGDAAAAPQGVVGGRRDGKGKSTIPELVPTNTGS
jgi:multisubunit Na+/H+ antiporter MnhF subunit